MSEQLDLVGLSPADPAAAEDVPEAMTGEQRATIRDLFKSLGFATAREQFDLVEVLVGVRLQTVSDLDSRTASLLITRLRVRVSSMSRTSTGDSWADREEVTWIDSSSPPQAV